MRNFIIIIILFCINLCAYAQTQVPSIYLSSSSSTYDTDDPNTSDKQSYEVTALLNKGATTLTQALDQFTNLQLHDMTGNGSQTIISMRGFGANASSNMLLMIDGIPIINPDLAATDLNFIPLAALNQIVVSTSSENTLYGDQAVGGVINLITNHNQYKNMQCTIGSYHQLACFYQANVNNDRINYHMNLYRQQTDNYRANNQYEQNSIIQQLSIKQPLTEIIMHAQFANEWMQYPGALNYAQVLANRRQATNDTDYFRNTKDFVYLKYKYEFMPKHNWHTTISHRGMDGNGRLSLPFSQSRYSYYLDSYWQANLAQQYRAGITLQFDNYQIASAFGSTTAKQRGLNLYLISSLPITNKTFIDIGARGAQQNAELQTTSKLDQQYRAVAMHAGINHYLQDNINLNLRYARNYRLPKVDENAFAASPLHTQRGDSYEAGMNWQSDFVNTKFKLYELLLANEIAFDPSQTPSQPFGSNRNLEPTNRFGWSLALDKAITKRLDISGEYNVVHARYKGGIYAGRQIPLVAEQVVSLRSQYQLQDNFWINLDAKYLAGQYAANDDANRQAKLAGYTLFNINLRYQIQKIQFSLRLNNIFNHTYYLYSLYQSSMDQMYFYPAADRNITVSLQYDLA